MDKSKKGVMLRLAMSALWPAMLVASLQGCQTMYPEESVPTDLKVVESPSRKFTLEKDVAFPSRGRQNETILYAGEYTKGLYSAKGDFYLSRAQTIGLKPPIGSIEDFRGGLFVPRDTSSECLVFWYQPSASALVPGIGWLTQAVVDSMTSAGGIKFYTWVPRTEKRLPGCNGNPAGPAS